MVGSVKRLGDDLVILHVKTEPVACQACGSPNMLTVRMSSEDSPVRVQVCPDCDERVWSPDT